MNDIIIIPAGRYAFCGDGLAWDSDESPRWVKLPTSSDGGYSIHLVTDDRIIEVGHGGTDIAEMALIPSETGSVILEADCPLVRHPLGGWSIGPYWMPECGEYVNLWRRDGSGHLVVVATAFMLPDARHVPAVLAKLLDAAAPGTGELFVDFDATREYHRYFSANDWETLDALALALSGAGS